MAQLRWCESPGFFDRGLQRICIFWSHTNVHNSFFIDSSQQISDFFLYKTLISMVDYYGEKTT